MNPLPNVSHLAQLLRGFRVPAAPATWLLAACLVLSLAAAIDAVWGDTQVQVDGPSPTLATLPPSA
ncbi:MAG TPA: hypothetical protein PLA97_13770 [Rubrivivax sp.]|nr:hypothetical protein [Rubrivivax sp.]